MFANFLKSASVFVSWNIFIRTCRSIAHLAYRFRVMTSPSWRSFPFGAKSSAHTGSSTRKLPLSPFVAKPMYLTRSSVTAITN